MIEAMACGTPVVAFRRGSVPEVIDHGVTGFIVDDIDESLQALDQISHFDRERCRMVFEQRFSAARMAGDYSKIYERLIETKSRTRARRLAEAVESLDLAVRANGDAASRTFLKAGCKRSQVQHQASIKTSTDPSHRSISTAAYRPRR